MIKTHIAHDTSAGERLLVRSLPTHGLPADAEIIYSGRNRVARVNRDGKNYVIKEFRVPNPVNRLAYTTLRKSKARRSFLNARRLLQMELLTPRPVGWAEVRRGPLLGLSYYVSEYVDGHDLRFWENNPEAERLLPHLAREMARLHSLGVWHKDFSPGNVLYRWEKGKEKPDFYYIDLNRMAFGVKSAGRLLRNFATIAPLEQMLPLARLYAPLTPLPLEQDEIVARAEAARRRFARSRHLPV